MATNSINDEGERQLEKNLVSEFQKGKTNTDGVCLSEYFPQFADRIENFEVHDDDVWVCSYPKSGTTWTQEMVWCIANNLDFEKAKVLLPERFPFLEHSTFFDCSSMAKKQLIIDQFPEYIWNSFELADTYSSPRFIKTHLPFHMLPEKIRTNKKKPKIIYVTRNVKDTCVSYFHHAQILEGYLGTFEEYCTMFLEGKVCWGSFWKHVLGFWERRKQENILFIKYEDMKTDLPSVIKETTKFLGKEALTEKEMKSLEEHLSFENMKANPAVNYEELITSYNRQKNVKLRKGKFIRSGKLNQWKEEMSEEIINLFNSWTEESLKDQDFVI